MIFPRTLNYMYIMSDGNIFYSYNGIDELILNNKKYLCVHGYHRWNDNKCILIYNTNADIDASSNKININACVDTCENGNSSVSNSTCVCANVCVRDNGNSSMSNSACTCVDEKGNSLMSNNACTCVDEKGNSLMSNNACTCADENKNSLMSNSAHTCANVRVRDPLMFSFAPKFKISASKYIQKHKFSISTKHVTRCVYMHENVSSLIRSLHKISSTLNGIFLEYNFYHLITANSISSEDIDNGFKYFLSHKSHFRHRRRGYTRVIQRYGNILRSTNPNVIQLLIDYIHSIHSMLGITSSNITIGSKSSVQVGKYTVCGKIDFILNTTELYDIKVNSTNKYSQWRRQLELYKSPSINKMGIINLYNGKLILFE